jgi:acyl carrier protein
MAAALDSQGERRWSSKGIGTISPAQGVEILGKLLRLDAPQVGVIPIDWDKIAQLFPAGSEPPLLSEMTREAAAQAGSRAEQINPELLERLRSTPREERLEVLVTYMRGQVTSVLGLDAGYELEPHRGFFEMGMDSLMALELKNRLQSNLGYSIPATLVFEYPTIESLSEYLLQEVLTFEVADDGAAPAPTPAVGTDGALDEELLANIDQLSDEEVDLLLGRMMTQGEVAHER